MIKLYDRIKELSYVIGTGNITLSGAMRGFSTFSSCYSNGDILFYAITDGTNYELGSGTYISSSNVIARFPVKTTNSNNLVNFAEGLKEVYVNYPATNAVFNTSGINPVPQNSGLAFWTSSNSLSYSSNFVIDSGRGRIGINKSNPAYTIDIGGTSSNSIIRSSGFLVGNSGIHFPSGNDGTSAYSGGIQFVHFEKNQLDLNSSNFFQLSGIVNQNILLKKQNANTIFAGPSGGCTPPCSPDYPTFRSLVIDDIPDLSSLYYPFSSAILLSGVLRSGINTASGIAVESSGHLNTRITAVSGYLDNRINNILPLLNTSISSNISNGRISLSSTASIFDGSGTTIYFTPHNGNQISLYNSSSSAWQSVNISGQPIATFASLSQSTTYDIFAYLNSNNLAFELQQWQMHDSNWEETGGWSEESYRIVAVTNVSGVLCKNNNLTRKYLGTIYTSSLFQDTPQKRYIYNYYNKVKRPVRSVFASNTSWVRNDTVWRQLPILSPIDLISGYDGVVDLNCVVRCSLPGDNQCGYNLGIFAISEITSLGTFIYNNLDLDLLDEFSLENYTSRNLGYVSYSDFVFGDYRDNISKNLVAKLSMDVTTMTRLYGIERATTTNINKPSIVINNLYGQYGLIGTYEC